jgi:apolipoprotein N-acyltransferase
MAEGISNAMNTRFRDRLSLCSAIAMGLGVSTGHPLGIIAAAGMPLACLMPGTRKAAFKSTLGYYVAGIWPIVPGLDRYIGQSATSLIPVAMWVLAAILLSVPWTIAWTSDRRFNYLWRVPLALMVTIVPPLGIIGLASPVTAAGYLFPGTAWVGLAAVALLPGIVLSTHALALRRRCAVLCLVSASAVGLAIGGRLFARGDAAPPTGWSAVNTQFGDVRQPFRDYLAAQFVQQKAAETSARVLIFPESVVPRWSEATEAFWRQSLDRCRTRGQILAIGAGLPAKTGTPKDDRERLSDLRSYDFGAAIDVLKRIDPQSPPAMQRGVFPNAPIKSLPEPIDNTLLIVGAESAAFYQRVPVPVGMWRPFNRISVPLRLNAPGVLAIDHQRAAVLICYEQMLTFPILASMLQHPTVIVGISNTFWVDHTTIPRYQATALRGWAKLFRLPYILAVNS